MPDNLQNRSGSDRQRIDVNEDYELRDWSKKFGVSKDQLKEAVQAVGDQADRVEEFLKRRGLVVIVSDFFESPEQLVRTIEPLRFHGNEVVLFQVLDPQEIAPTFRDAAVLVDLETRQQMEVTPDYARQEYRAKMDAHLADLRARTRGAGLDYFLLQTDRPLDAALREYLTIRHKKN